MVADQPQRFLKSTSRLKGLNLMHLNSDLANKLFCFSIIIFLQKGMHYANKYTLCMFLCLRLYSCSLYVDSYFSYSQKWRQISNHKYRNKNQKQSQLDLFQISGDYLPLLSWMMWTESQNIWGASDGPFKMQFIHL